MKTLKDFEVEYRKTPQGQERLASLENALRAATRQAFTIWIPDKTCRFKFGVMGDTHNGSRYEMVEALNLFYERCEAEGIKDVLHAGDCLDGHRLYKGQEFEVHRLGWDEQSQHWAKVTPKIKGITTHFITGNHDDSLTKLAGIRVGKGLELLRKDHRFLGATQGRITFNNGKAKLNVMLLHPGGGSSYALSYRPQKIVEQLEGGTKPDMLCIGNYHKAEFMPSYRNVAVVQVGCFQRQTPFMVEKGLAAMTGGWLFEVGVGRHANTFQAEFVALY